MKCDVSANILLAELKIWCCSGFSIKYVITLAMMYASLEFFFELVQLEQNVVGNVKGILVSVSPKAIAVGKYEDVFESKLVDS